MQGLDFLTILVVFGIIFILGYCKITGQTLTELIKDIIGLIKEKGGKDV